jgi:hypothetical protein
MGKSALPSKKAKLENAKDKVGGESFWNMLIIQKINERNMSFTPHMIWLFLDGCQFIFLDF